MDAISIKPMTLADLRWGLKGNEDLLDKLECIKYYKTAKNIEKIRVKIKKLVSNENDKKRLLEINDIDKLKTEVGKWNESNCINILLKLKREGLIKIYKDILGYTDADIEDLRGSAPKTSNLSAVQIVGGRKNKPFTITEQKDFLKDKDLGDIVDFDEFTTEFIKKDKEELELTNPQKSLIRKFTISNEVGLIAIWGLGTGKTTLATISTMIYLQIYPDSKVIFIAPASLLVNFVKTLDSYNVNIRDSRIEFYSYESYLRRKANCENALVIIDEAHNLRTLPKYDILEGTLGKEETYKLKYMFGKRGGEIRRLCLNKARKILLLTGTPMVNSPYDIQQLMLMINKVPIVNKMSDNKFYEMLNSVEKTRDYFSCKLSIFYNPKVDKREDDPFPEKKEDFLITYFPKEYAKAYDILRTNPSLNNALANIEKLLGKTKTNRLRKYLEPKNPKASKEFEDQDEDGNPKAFYNGVRRLVNLTDDIKVKSIIDNILEWNKKHKNSRNVIYTGFIDSGVKLLQKQIKDAGLSASIVMGGMGMKQKAEAVDKYNKGDLDILLITRSGAEGLDLKKTTNLYLLDGVWNEALARQIIGRGVRYKSHDDLPLKDRFVNVYRVFIIKEEEKDFAEKIKEATKYPNDFEILIALIKEAEVIDRFLGGGKTFVAEAKEAIKEKFKERNKNKVEKRSPTQISGFVGSEILKNRDIFDDEKINRFKTKNDFIFEYFDTNSKTIPELGRPEEMFITLPFIPTIDLRMYILSNSKQVKIDNVFDILDNKKFVENLESNYCMTENEKEYERQITKLMNNKDFKEREISEKDFKDIRIKIYSRIINKSLKEVNIDFDKYKKKKISNTDIEQFFINQGLVKAMIDLTGLNKDTREVVRILNPTAGDGTILKYLINKYSNKHRLFLRTTELDDRTELKKVLKNDLDILYEEPDFMKLRITDAFNYIFMNPPVRVKIENKVYATTRYIIKAYSFLEGKGELVSVVPAELFRLKKNRASFEINLYKIMKPQKVSYSKPINVNVIEDGKTVKKNVMLVHIIKGISVDKMIKEVKEDIKDRDDFLKEIKDMKKKEKDLDKDLMLDEESEKRKQEIKERTVKEYKDFINKTMKDMKK